MRGYTQRELADAFSAVGLAEGDIVYLTTQLYGLGPMADATNRLDFLERFYAAIRSAIGQGGTLVVPTFTQQVGQFGLPYIHEETVSLTGILGEHVRQRADSIRSLHPVFSVAAIGPRQDELCRDVSPVAFGVDSAFDRLARLGGKAVCLGFEYYSGHIVSLMHHVETMFAVPYYYNKIVQSAVHAEGKKIDREFVINVRYLGMECIFDYRKYTDALAERGMIRSAPIGSGDMHAVDLKDMMDVGVSQLKDDLYAFLSHPPEYRRGEIPMEGPESGGLDAAPREANWVGFKIGAR